MTGYDGGFTLGLPRPVHSIRAKPVTADDLRNPFRWLFILPGSPEARARIVGQIEQQRERAFREIWEAMFPGEAL